MGAGRADGRRTEEAREAEPDVRGRRGERGPGDLVCALVERIRGRGHHDRQTGADELSEELRAGRGADEVARLEVLHEVARPGGRGGKG